MNSPARPLHTASVVGTAALAGAAIFFGIGTLGLRGKLPEAGVEGLLVMVLVFLLLGAGWAIRRRLSYGFLAPVLGLSAALVGYLGYDDPSRPAAPELGRVAAADSKNFTAYRWLIKSDPDKRREGLPKRPQLPPVATGKQAEWLTLADQHRAEVDAAWAADDFGRKWIDATAETAPEGVYPLGARPEDAPDFQVIRHIAQTRWAHAQLLMHDRRGDEAARVLLPMLRAHYNLQRGATTLLPQMIAVVVLKGTYQRLEMLADAGGLSPTVRTDVAGALRDAPAIAATFRNAFLGEQMLARFYMDEMSRDSGKIVQAVASSENARVPAVPVLSRLFYNPNRSAREYAEFLNEVCRLAEERQLEGLAQKSVELEKRLAHKQLKNPVGQMLMEMALPAFSKVCAAAWTMEDQRVALLKRMEQA